MERKEAFINGFVSLIVVASVCTAVECHLLGAAVGLLCLGLYAVDCICLHHTPQQTTTPPPRDGAVHDSGEERTGRAEWRSDEIPPVPISDNAEGEVVICGSVYKKRGVKVQTDNSPKKGFAAVGGFAVEGNMHIKGSVYKSRRQVITKKSLWVSGSIYKNEVNIKVGGDLHIESGSLYDNKGSIEVEGDLTLTDGSCYGNLNIRVGGNLWCKNGSLYKNCELFVGKNLKVSSEIYKNGKDEGKMLVGGQIICGGSMYENDGLDDDIKALSTVKVAQTLKKTIRSPKSKIRSPGRSPRGKGLVVGLSPTAKIEALEVRSPD